MNPVWRSSRKFWSRNVSSTTSPRSLSARMPVRSTLPEWRELLVDRVEIVAPDVR